MFCQTSAASIIGILEYRYMYLFCFEDGSVCYRIGCCARLFRAVTILSHVHTPEPQQNILLPSKTTAMKKEVNIVIKYTRLGNKTDISLNLLNKTQFLNRIFRIGSKHSID